jgi:hypothetical protein
MTKRQHGENRGYDANDEPSEGNVNQRFPGWLREKLLKQRAKENNGPSAQCREVFEIVKPQLSRLLPLLRYVR